MVTPRARAPYEEIAERFDAIYMRDNHLLLRDIGALNTTDSYIDRVAFHALADEDRRMNALAWRADLYELGWTEREFDDEVNRRADAAAAAST